MSAYKEFTGKTVEEALRAAREEFGAELNDLDFEILTPGSRGVLGMGAEPARIVAAPREALGVPRPSRDAAAATPLPVPPAREGGAFGERDRGPRRDERGPRRDDRPPRRDDRPRDDRPRDDRPPRRDDRPRDDRPARRDTAQPASRPDEPMPRRGNAVDVSDLGGGGGRCCVVVPSLRNAPSSRLPKRRPRRWPPDSASSRRS
ncbi:MAG: Jag N-terminal domain-containing protein [Candidatus Limnocylindrales bacterium]